MRASSFPAALSLLVFALVGMVFARPTEVYAPPLTFPSVNASLKAGGRYNVTWDTSKAPENITNDRGRVVLAKDGVQDPDHPLAKGFLLLDGRVEVTIPKDVQPGNAYQLVHEPPMMIAFTILCLFFVSSLVGAIPVEQRDVFNPPITSPDANTVWRVGDKVNVTWDTTDIPPDSQITNPIGRVVLGFETSESLNLMVDSPLAQGFLLKNGQVSITVPNVPPRNNYIVVVFGDSGNTSPQFRITGGAGNATSSSAARTSTESPSVTAPIPISGTTITGGSAAGPTSTPPSTPATSSIVDVPTPASTQTTPLTTPAATSTAASSAESLAASSSSSSTDLPTGTALPADTNSATGFGMTLYYALAPLTLWALL
ncbi:hypothetical protein EYR40_009252 [Pleurotus pulmonarius]|nr:hypothetical protein EYR36_005377 [Pleurotus pulmonarius]KAF4590656.1 hypothetical protein EYR40_009252 [Pleurotus pulmonarius]